MSVINSIQQTSEKAIEKSEEFIKNSENYYKLKIFQVLTSSLSLVFNFAMVGIFMLIAFIFLAVATSSIIGKALNNPFLGYVSVAIIFFLFAILAYSGRKKIENLVIQNLSKKYFDDEDNL